MKGVRAADGAVARAAHGGNEIRLFADAGGLSVDARRCGHVVVAKTPIDLVVDGVPLSRRQALRRDSLRLSPPFVPASDDERSPSCVSASDDERRRQPEQVVGNVAALVYKKAMVDLSGAEAFADFGDWGVRLVARADGVAYRFETRRDGELVVTSERGGVTIPDGAAPCWFSATPDFGCEETVPRKCRADAPALATNEVAYLPLVYEANGAAVAVTDADVRDYPFLYLAADPSSSTNGLPRFVSRFAPAPAKTRYAISQWVDQRPFVRGQFVRVAEHASFLVRTRGTRTFPWRVFALADSPARLCESDIVFALATPAAKGADFSWVRPGLATWEWWNDWDNQGKADGCTTATYERFIDFAATNGLAYAILDGGWSDGLDVFDWNDAGRPWRFNPKVDVPHLVAYAAARNVGLILWLSWAQAFGDEAEVARRFAQLGVKGLKVDFIDRGDAEAVRFMERFAAACAAERLVVDFHGACRPTGLHRAWPNVLNYEGVYGLEQMKWFKGDADMPTADVRAFYLRLTAGPMDYTPGAMLNHAVGSGYRGEAAGHAPGSFGTRARQMAMVALFEAPLQMLCDSPSNYECNAECFRFMAGVPTTWADVRGLGGTPDTVAACARKAKDGAWYAAGIGVSSAQDFAFDTSFLGAGEWTAEIFRDAPDSDVAPTRYVHETRRLRAGDRLAFRLAPAGGFVVKFMRYRRGEKTGSGRDSKERSFSSRAGTGTRASGS